MPTLQQMRYLVSVADHLHFRRAAEASNVTQPTLSAQLKELELRLGVQLVERGRSRVIVTPLGAEVVARARRVLRDVEEIRDLARRGQRPLSGTIRLGVAMSLGSYLLPVMIPDLQQSHTRLRFYMREGLPDALVDQLENGKIDLLFCPLPVENSDLVVKPLFVEPLRLVVPTDHRLAQKEVVDPADLAGETLLTLEPGHRLYEQISSLSVEYNAQISPDFEGTSLDTLRQMVSMKLGISLLPALYIRSEVAREKMLVDRPIAGTEPARTIGMIWRRGSARHEEFADLFDILAGILAARAPEVHVVADEAPPL
ncbi:MAG: LysR substrate-binding domain-containing protein [Pseudomonadota bacterium]